MKKANGILKISRSFENGQTSEAWGKDGFRVATVKGLPPDKVFFERKPDPTDDEDDLPGREDFPELAWVSSANFQRIEARDGKECRVHEDDVIWQEDVPTRVHAWIDAETRLPVALEDHSTVRTYSIYRSTSSTPLALPPAFAAKIERYLASAAKPVKPSF